MSEQAYLPVEFAELPPISTVVSRAAKFLKDAGVEDVVVDPDTLLPNVWQGLWIVSYVGRQGEHLDGGGLVVSKDDVRWLSSNPGDDAWIGAAVPGEEDDEEDDDESEAALDSFDEDREFSALTTLFDISQADVDAAETPFMKAFLGDVLRQKQIRASADVADDSVCVMAIPADSDPVHGIGPEDKHATLLYFGSISQHADPAAMEAGVDWIEEILRAIAANVAPFTAFVTGVEPLGDGGAQVWMLDSPNLQDLFAGIRAADETVAALYDGADATRYPEYTPHVTIGYAPDPDAGDTEDQPVTPEDLERAGEVDEILFDRLSLWIGGDEHRDIPLLGDPDTSEFEALFALVASGFDDEQIRIPRGNGRLSGRWVETPGHMLQGVIDEVDRSTASDDVKAHVAAAYDTATGLDTLQSPETISEQFDDMVGSLNRALAGTSDIKAITHIEAARDALLDIRNVDWSMHDEESDLDKPGLIGGDEPDYALMTPEEVKEATQTAIRDLWAADDSRDNAALARAQRAVMEGLRARAQIGAQVAGLPIEVKKEDDEGDWSGYSLSAGLLLVDRASGSQVGSMRRTIEPAETTGGAVTNEYFALAPAFQNKGLAVHVAEELESWYADNGIEKILVHANIDVGGYTWAKTGFDLDPEEESPRSFYGNKLADVVGELDGVTGGSPAGYQALWTDYQSSRLYREDFIFDDDSLRRAIDDLAALDPGIDAEAYYEDLMDAEAYGDDKERAATLLDDLRQAIAKTPQWDRDEMGLRDLIDSWAQELDDGEEPTITMYDLATLGQGTRFEREDVQKIYFPDPATPPQEQRVKTWPGKRALLNSDWQGVKYLIQDEEW